MCAKTLPASVGRREQLCSQKNFFYPRAIIRRQRKDLFIIITSGGGGYLGLLSQSTS